MSAKQLRQKSAAELQKELLDLIYFHGYTQAEAAQKLKIPLGTVKTRVRAAVNELRKLFRVHL
jgi:RNA polymerase sigma-70 factor (ECF subfamily)